MSDLAGTLTALQFGDSFFPSGSTSFSWGLEVLSDDGVVADAVALRAFVFGQLRARWAMFDRPVVVASHRESANLVVIAAIDRQVEVQTPCAEFRSASCRMGEAMLSVFAKLGMDDAALYRNMIGRGDAHGHIAAVQGCLWGQSGLGESEAVALSAHTFCVGLAGAGIRLGCISHVDAQRILMEARNEIARLAALPIPPIEDISAYGTEAEIAVMRHATSRTRAFAN